MSHKSDPAARAPIMTTVLNRVRKLPPEERAIPDSTTLVGDFAGGQDVLLKKDGKYYCGTIVEVDVVREQCFVKFGDNTDSWACFQDLVKLSTPKDPMCVVCRKSAPKSRNEIKECDKCKRGYHRQCHQPIMPNDDKEDSYWICKRCTDNDPIKSKQKSVTRLSISSPATSNMLRPLIYNPNSLTWDTYHRSNLQQIYCYCGKKGKWDSQMLQCARCRQWFHEKCISCLRFPVYCGDRFYVFVCYTCNEGTEFLRRLEITWVEMVHLMLYNLTLYKAKKYYDFDSVILPYVEDNWNALQLPPKIANVNKNERREHILSVLTKNRNRFKCGREMKKRTTIWGLRVLLPPPAPTISLPSTGLIKELELKQRWQGNRQLQFLPYIDDSPILRISNDIMMGTAYVDDQVQSEAESPCVSPKSEVDDEYNEKSASFIGAVKKSVPFPTSGSLKHKKRLLSLNKKRDKFLRRQKRKITKDTPRRFTRLSLDTNASSKKPNSPLTPPTSVSAPPTPPNSGSSSNIHSELSMDYNDSTSFVTNIKKEKAPTPTDEPHTPCDTSGDETSSKSTLDLIIPPPKDFEGKNNPFRASPRVDDARKRRSKDSITLPLPLTAVIPGPEKPTTSNLKRPLKRQLSEKDICVGPNGEVKRRRLKRGRNGLNITGAAGTASKTATVLPVKADSDWKQQLEPSLITDCVDYALNGRRLRQRADKDQKDKKPPTPKPSPAKTEPDQWMDDLKSSVHSYFGAATRIQDGERFTIKAKRYGPTGKLEYLMEWEGINSSLQQ